MPHRLIPRLPHRPTARLTARRPALVLVALLATALVAGPTPAPPAEATGLLAAVGPTLGAQDLVLEPETPVKVVDPPYDGPTTSTRGLRTEASAQAAYPAAQSLDLHSSPGSRRTLFLDFDGADALGGAWDVTGAQPGWSLDTDPAFSDRELSAVQDVWQLVAEDYAPFDVDVTTEDPGSAAITRSGSLDQVYGTRVLVTGSSTLRSSADTTVCGGGCGGVAWMGVFDSSTYHAEYQPALVFPEHLSDDVKSIADAVSHEAGHTLGLSHDGTVAHDGIAARDYHSGTGLWGPIMGSPYGAPLSQWSRGDYPWASQQQDDVALISTGGAPLRTDRVGATVGTATALPAPSGTPAATGTIETRGDVDVFALGTCSGQVGVQASPAALGPDLDISLRLLDGDARVLASADPVATRSSRAVAAGLGASASVQVAGSTQLWASVDGTGGTGYSDYGSLGRYLLSATGCAPTGGGPGSPRSLTATVVPGGSGTDVAVTWAAPVTGPAAGYTVMLSPGGLVREEPGSATGTVLGGLRPGTSYVVSVLASDATGVVSAPATASVLVPARAPSGVLGLQASAGADGRGLITWSPPLDDGGSAVTAYLVRLGSQSQVFDAGVRSVTVDGLSPGASYAVTVSAQNAAGTGPETSGQLTVPGPAPAVPGSSTGGAGGAALAAPTVLRPVVAPARRGTARVGARLSVRQGTWPVPVTVRYRWVLDGRVLPGAGRSWARPPAAWAGRKVAVRMSVSASGYQPVRRTISWGRLKR